MQVFLSVCILLLSILAYDLMGRAFCIKCRYSPVLPERICIGFFLYFAAFQIVALIMIFTRQKLHVLGAVWLVLLLLLSAASAAIAAGHKKRERVQRKCAPTVISVRPSGAARALFLLMTAAVICECLTGLLMQRNIGWDFAYYIGNMTTSVATDMSMTAAAG